MILGRKKEEEKYTKKLHRKLDKSWVQNKEGPKRGIISNREGLRAKNDC